MCLKRMIQCLLMTMGILLTLTSFANNAQPTLRVGVILGMPFAQNVDGQYSGIAVDIWEKIAAQHHWKYTYVPLGENVNNDLARLSKDGDLDIILGVISVTSERIKSTSFTHYFYLGSTGIMTQKYEWGIFDTMRLLFSKNLMLLILILLMTFVVYFIFIYLIERNKKQSENDNVTLTYHVWMHLFQQRIDYMPKTTLGRVLGIIWIVTSATILIAINANLTSAMTIDRYTVSSKTSTIDGLRSAKIAGVIGRQEIVVAEKHDIRVIKVPYFSQAINLLNKGAVDGIVCETPLGEEYIKAHDEKNLVMSPLILENDGASFAVKQNSPYLHDLDQGILDLQDNDSVLVICKKYIDDVSNCYI